MHILKRIATFYLKGIDASIRLLGAGFIMIFFLSVIYGIFYGISLLPFLSINPTGWTYVVSLILLPPLLRISIIGAGFSIPALFPQKTKKPAPSHGTGLK